MTVEEIYAITPDDNGWRRLPSGIYVTLGNGKASTAKFTDCRQSQSFTNPRREGNA